MMDCPLRNLSAIVFVGFVAAASGGTVHTDSLYCAAIDSMVAYHVYLRSDYSARAAAGERFPVMYLLHGLGSTGSMWHQGVQWKDQAGTHVTNPHADWAVDSADLIIVAPSDGSCSSWWLDSPVDSSSMASTFLVSQLRSRIDSTYATLSSRGSRGLCGVSMGGYGALHNALLYSDLYGACYGAVPCVRLTNWSGKNMFLEPVLGPYPPQAQNWLAADVFTNVASFAGKDLSVGFYTKQGDIFRDDNRALDSAMTVLGIAHDFTLYPTGGHDIPDEASMVMMVKWMAAHLEPSAMVGDRHVSRRLVDPVRPARWTAVDILGRSLPGSGRMRAGRNAGSPGTIAVTTGMSGLVLHQRGQ